MAVNNSVNDEGSGNEAELNNMDMEVQKGDCNNDDVCLTDLIKSVDQAEILQAAGVEVEIATTNNKHNTVMFVL